MMRLSMGTGFFLATLLTACEASQPPSAAVIAATGGEPNPQVMALGDYKAALQLFRELNYTPEAWQAGVREVPRVYLAQIDDRWAKVTTKEIDVNLKKRLFFRAIGPLALRSNELISADRKRLQALQESPSAEDSNWLQGLATVYGLDTNEFNSNAALKEQLLLRVDIVPPSLILAQAAEESGWGTSRFAFTGNALFGQWTWGGDGMLPAQQRDGKGDYKIASFESPLDSVRAHALNLNSHSAYSEFRQQRAALRAANERISGLALAGKLTNYSERGEDYVKSLRSIINYNNLDAVDDAYLGNGQAIVMVDNDI